MEFTTRDFLYLLGLAVTAAGIVGAVASRLTRLETWQEATEKRIDAVEVQGDKLAQEMAGMTATMKSLIARIDEVLAEVRGQ